MKKLFRTGDYLMLGLAGVVDIYNDLKDPLGVMGKIYGDSPQRWIPNLYKKTNYYGAVYYGLKTGYIEKVIKNGEPYIRLSAKGKEKIQRDFPISRWQNNKWDKKWRVVIFDIEEKNRKDRDFLRLKLRELGFGMIQESVWISPYDVALDFQEFIKSFGLEDKVFVMEVSNLLAGDPKVLVDKIWRLDKINEKYRELHDKLTFLHDREKKSTNGDKGDEGDEGEKMVGVEGVENEEVRGKILKEIKSEYLQILSEDPCLPKELLPEDWYGEKVKKLL